MRICIVSIVMFSTLTTNASSHAQVEIVVPDAGRAKTTAKVENGILGVANSLTGPRGSPREGVGGCFYAAATKPKPGCAAISDCNLVCSRRGPIRGC